MQTGKLKFFWVLCSLTLGLSAACATNSRLPSSPNIDPSIHHEFISHPQDKRKKVEFYWMKPEGTGPWPVIVSIHGHQEPDRPGAYASLPWVKREVAMGYVAVAVSQPGYGNSDGPPDYCGPFTQEAVRAVLKHFREMDITKSNKMALDGVSRGAIVASMIATKEPTLAALVLNVGVYDLKAAYEALKTSKDGQGINENIATEAGTSDQAFKERSAPLFVDQIKTPTLVMTAENDQPESVRQAKQFADELKKHGVPVKFMNFQGFGHFVPYKLRNDQIDPFLNEYLSK